MSLPWPVVILICSVIGGVVVFFLKQTARLKREKEGLMQAHPEEPWLWNQKWAKGKIKTSSRNFKLSLFSLVVWSFFCVALVFVFFEKPNDLPVKIMALVFLLSEFFFIAGFVYLLIRRSKYGQSVLEMASVPGVIGGQFAGVIRTSVKVKMEDLFRIRLRCIHGKESGHGKSRRIHRNTIWDTELLIAHDLLQHEGNQSAIPFLFQIPYQCRQTDQCKADDYIEWKLEVTAKTPGVDYHSEFEVPIFNTAESDPDFVVDESLIARYVAPEDPERDLRDAGIRRTVSPNGDGTRFIFPMARQLGTALGVAIMAIAFGGVPVFLFYQDVEWWIAIPFSIIFGLIGVFLLFVSLDLFFYRSVVDVSPDGLSLKAGLFGGRRRRWIPLSEVEAIKLDSNMGSEQQKYYDIVAVCSNGKKVTLGKHLPGQRLANAILQQIEQALLD